MATETTEATKLQDIKFVWCSYDVFTMFYADGDFDPIFPENTIKLDDHYRLVKVPVSAVKTEDGVVKVEVCGGTWGEKKWPAKIWLQFNDSCWTDLAAATKRMLDRCLDHHQWSMKIVYELLATMNEVDCNFQEKPESTQGDFADFFLSVESSMGLRFGYVQQNIIRILQQHRRLSTQEKEAQ